LDTPKHSLGGPKDPAESNVTARLFDSNPVREVMPAIMGKVREALGLADAHTPRRPKSEKHATSGSSKTSGEAMANDPHREQKDKYHGRRGDLTKGDRERLDIGPPSARLLLSVELDSDDAGSLSRASKSSESRCDPAINLYQSLTPPVASSGSTPARAAERAAESAKVTKQRSVATFLPSLMGGYWSGSESGDEDIATAPPVRKNRMGQQARRQLWQKKYGANANHLKKEDQNRDQNRDRGWDSRKGAISPDGAGRRGDRSTGLSVSRNSQRHYDTPQTGHPMTPRRKNSRERASTSSQIQEQKPLHPSWEAARKAKLQKSQATFQGKKIVFD
jgi:hypothetical protein